LTQTQEKEPNFMCKFPRVFKIIALAALIVAACKSEPKKETDLVIEKLQGIVAIKGDTIIVSDCASNRFIKLPISARDSLGASPYAVVGFTTDKATGLRTIVSVSRAAEPVQMDCKRNQEHIAALHKSGRVVAVDNNRELKLLIENDRIEVQLASGEVIPFNYIDSGLVKDKFILMSSTLSSDFQSDLRIIVSTFPVDEKHESFHFHCIIELNQKRMEGIYNF
jgi:hypothetical protein